MRTCSETGLRNKPALWRPARSWVRFGGPSHSGTRQGLGATWWVRALLYGFGGTRWVSGILGGAWCDPVGLSPSLHGTLHRVWVL